MSNPEKPEAARKIPSSPEEQKSPKEKQKDHAAPTIHHEHAVIHPAESAVTHVDPGAIIF